MTDLELSAARVAEGLVRRVISNLALHDDLAEDLDLLRDAAAWMAALQPKPE